MAEVAEVAEVNEACAGCGNCNCICTTYTVYTVEYLFDSEEIIKYTQNCTGVLDKNTYETAVYQKYRNNKYRICSSSLVSEQKALEAACNLAFLMSYKFSTAFRKITEAKI